MSEVVSAAPVVRVAQNLTAIVELTTHLLTQAVHSANDRELPGGDAMVALAPAADPDEYAERIDYLEFHHYANPQRWPANTIDLEHEDRDDALAPVLQTLWFWSDELRQVHDVPLDGRRPTVITEANLIRWALDWMWDNEVHWDDFAQDIQNARRKVENILRDGERSQRGVPCMYDECGGVALFRKPIPVRGEDGEKTWVLSDWKCPRCKQSWNEDGYKRNVVAATEQVKREEINGELWCTPDVAAVMVRRSVKTIRTWVNRGELAVACLVVGRRMGFVRLSEVRERNERATRRNVA